MLQSTMDHSPVSGWSYVHTTNLPNRKELQMITRRDYKAIKKANRRALIDSCIPVLTYLAHLIGFMTLIACAVIAYIMLA